jgi:hypothetical protein
MGDAMHAFRLSVCLMLLLTGAAAAQAPKTPAAAPASYPAVTVTLPQPIADPSLEAVRNQLAEVTQRKDRAALARLVVAQGSFWQRDRRNVADKRHRHRGGARILVHA